MKPLNHTLFYAALTALTVAVSIALIAAAYLLTTYALNNPGRIILPDW